MATRTYLLPLLSSLALCFGLQFVALRAVGGRTLKSESNFFSSLARIQAATTGEVRTMLLGSSITGRLPDRVQGFEGFANMGSDGGSAVDVLRPLDRGVIPVAPTLVIEANKLDRALDPRPSEIGLAMEEPWFELGVRLPLLSAYARPSAFLYSVLLAAKIGRFELPMYNNDLRVTSWPRLVPEAEGNVVSGDQRRLVDELSSIIARLRAKGVRVVIVWLPPARDASHPLPGWILSLAAQSGAEWWDMGEEADPRLVTLTDGVHMSAVSAQRTVASLRKGLGAEPPLHLRE